MILLDTSAVLAFLQSEPGGDHVGQLLAEGNAWVASITWFELGIKLAGRRATEESLDLLHQTLAGTVDVSKGVSDAALALRRAAGYRIPAVDALVAGAAKVRQFHLVHRDKHMARIPQHILQHTTLPYPNKLVPC